MTEERCTQVRQECDGLRQANTDLHLALDKEKVQPVFICFVACITWNNNMSWLFPSQTIPIDTKT